MVVLALTARQWRSLTEATGLRGAFADLASRLGADWRYESDRWRARKELCALLEPWIAQRNLTEMREAFDRHGVLWGPYQTVKQLIAEDPRASSANQMFADVDHPDLGRFLTTSSPIRFGAAAAQSPRPAPTLGQHTEEVIREFGLES